MASKRRRTNGPPSASRLHSHTRTLLRALPGGSPPLWSSLGSGEGSACVHRAPPRGSPLMLCALSPGPGAGGREMEQSRAVLGLRRGRFWRRACWPLLARGPSGGQGPRPRCFTLHRFCSTHRQPLSSSKREQGPVGTRGRHPKSHC